MSYQYKEIELSKITVIGAGNIGPDICLHFAKCFAPDEVELVLVDISQDALDSAQARIEKKIEKALEVRAYSALLGDEMLNSITYTTDYDEITGSSLVLEAATEDEAITAVNFFTADDNVDYVVRIYDDFDGTTLSNQLDEVTGNLTYTGLHTVDLNDEIGIFSGDDFYVYLSLSSGGFPYDRTSDVPVLLGGDSRVIVPSAANTGESYYKDEDAWSDFYDYIDDSGFENTGNICIKALAFHDPTLSASSYSDPQHNVLIANYPNPFNDYTVIKYNISSTSSVKLFIYNSMGQLITQVDEGTRSPGQYSYTWNATTSKGVEANVGLYFCTIEIDGQKVDSRKMLKK